MLKAKKYDWKDSNLALFGSDTEKQVKKESAETEPAWKIANPEEVGLVVWRIVKFKVTRVDRDEYGEFFSGDSYIILNKYKDPESDEIKMDVHFWIGKYSTQDEYGTAAYKTVELDTYLDDKPIQHREVQGNESQKFKSYFPAITLLKGGADTGFRRVVAEEYKTRLFKVVGERKNISVTEVTLRKGSVNDEDSFILDKGFEIFVFNGSSSNKDEKFRVAQYVQQLKSDRSGKPKVEHVPEHEFQRMLPDGGKRKQKPEPVEITRQIFQLSDRSGSLEFKDVGSFSKDSLRSDDVFIVSVQDHAYVWIGAEASIDERKNAMAYGHKLLMKSELPFRPITVISEGKEPASFNELF